MYHSTLRKGLSDVLSQLKPLNSPQGRNFRIQDLAEADKSAKTLDVEVTDLLVPPDIEIEHTVNHEANLQYELGYDVSFEK